MRRGAAVLAPCVVCAVALLVVGCHAHAAGVGPAAARLGNVAACKAYSGLPPGWGRDRHAGMVKVDGGDFVLGSQRGYAEERPPVEARTSAFWIDRTAVTNAQFAAFVKATGYVSTAEREGTAGGAAVFVQPHSAADLAGPGDWWQLRPHANWRHPSGARSSIEGRANQPVVDVSLADAEAYARWLGRELPSEAQWEHAAKAGRDNVQADQAVKGAHDHWRVNAWQGRFPFHDSAKDGFAGPAPVGCYPASPYGIYDMVGNVWEWTRDGWTPNHAARVPEGDARKAMAGMGLAMSTAPMATRGGKAHFNVIKGGSFLCSSSYCARARASSRQRAETDLPAVNLGFRTVAMK